MMKESEVVLPERTMDKCCDAQTALPPVAVDLDKLEKKLRGSGFRMVCRHPDIDGDPINASTRVCMIDVGEPNQCEMSQLSNPRRVTDKRACDFWRKKAQKEPTPLSIAEGLALLAFAREHSSPRQVDGQVPGRVQP